MSDDSELKKNVTFSSFKYSQWRNFDEKEWDENREKYLSHAINILGKTPTHDFSDSVFIEEFSFPNFRVEKYELNVSGSGNVLDDFVPIYIFIPNNLKKSEPSSINHSSIPNFAPSPAIIIPYIQKNEINLDSLSETLARSPSESLSGSQSKKLSDSSCNFPSENIELNLCRKLVARGKIIALFDLLGYGSRQEEGGLQYIFTRLLLYGLTMTGKNCYDLQLVFEFLKNRSDVDNKRIGVIGHGVGGQLAIWSSILSPELKMIVSSSGIARIGGSKSLLAHHINSDLSMYLPGFLNTKGNFFDMQQLISLNFPRPLMLLSGTNDPQLPIEGVAEIHKWLEDLYHAKQPESSAKKIQTIRHQGGHELPAFWQDEICDFIDKFL
ncbi:MAG: alpha/beta hydrolase family protein [Promethearchaeota archaeon]